MKKLLLACLVALSLAAAGCADFASTRSRSRSRTSAGGPAPTDAGVLVEQATAAPPYQGRIDLNQVTAAVTAAFSRSGQGMVADLNAGEYVVTPP